MQGSYIIASTYESYWNDELKLWMPKPYEATQFDTGYKAKCCIGFRGLEKCGVKKLVITLKNCDN